MSLPPGGSVISDNSSSGGHALKMTQDATTTTTFSLPSQATSLSVTARADSCAGSPSLSVTVDGKGAIISTNVGSGVYANYGSSTLNLAGGSHTLAISGTNLGPVYRGKSNNAKCYRNLYVDLATFYGPTASPPTVSLAASPASISSGQSSTLSWNSTNATSCSASGAWSGTQLTSGSQTVSPTATSTYSLTCSGAGGSATASATVTLTSASSSSIYWGSYLNKSGNVHYYGATDINGKAWTDGPWSSTLPGDTWDTFEAHSGGKTMSLIHYGQPAPWRQAWSSAPASDGWNRHAIPVIDMDTTIDNSGNHTISDQTIANGTATINGQTFDSWWTQWFTAAKNWGHPFFFIPDVEMNGQWEPYSPFQLNNTPASFVAMWQHMHDLANSVGATNVTWVWCPNIDPSSASSIYRPLTNLYPGNSYVDWVGLDGFNMGSSMTFDQLFSSSVSNINSITGSSKPFMISQISATPNALPSKAAWVSDTLAQLQTAKYSQIKALVWFNWWHADGGTRDNDLETPYNGTIPIPISQWASNANMPAFQAFSKGISPSYFKPKLTTMPGFGKVPTP
jgi:hypothetical protein